MAPKTSSVPTTSSKPSGRQPLGQILKPEAREITTLGSKHSNYRPASWPMHLGLTELQDESFKLHADTSGHWNLINTSGKGEPVPLYCKTGKVITARVVCVPVLADANAIHISKEDLISGAYRARASAGQSGEGSRTSFRPQKYFIYEVKTGRKSPAADPTSGSAKLGSKQPKQSGRRGNNPSVPHVPARRT